MFTRLSVHCADRMTALFAAFPDAASYAAATPAQLEPYLASLGLFRAKAKALVAMGKQLVAHHGGEVPRSRAVLATLPGVGQKTAGVVSMHLEGDPAFPVDTHVGRLARRLGFTRETDPDAVEADLQRLLPSDQWMTGHQLLVWHGRRTCFARNPDCERCVVAALCPKVGVKKPAPR